MMINFLVRRMNGILGELGQRFFYNVSDGGRVYCMSTLSAVNELGSVGFTHSAFNLGYEAAIHTCSIDGNLIPPGALITFVQRGLQYLEMEANLSNSDVDADVDEDFSFLTSTDLLTKDVQELQRMVKEKRRTLRKDRDKEHETEHRGERKRGRLRKVRFQDEEPKSQDASGGKEAIAEPDNKVALKSEENRSSAGIARTNAPRSILRRRHRM
ncbi:hypothetical protein Dimus_017200 [Dionaea muscipula]